MSRKKNSVESMESRLQLAEVAEKVLLSLKKEYPELRIVKTINIPGDTKLSLSTGGGSAFYYRDRYIVLVDRQFIAFKDGDPLGDSPKKQVRVWDIFKTIFNQDITILSFMSGYTLELSKFFAYKVHKTGGFNKYNRFGNSIYMAETFADNFIESEIKKAVLESIAYVDSLKKDEDIFE